MIDTHAHLDACSDRPSAVVARARAAGVGRILTVGTTLETCRTAISIAEREEDVFAVVGIHPHEAGGPDASKLRDLAQLCTSEKVVALGETGLDHFRDYAPHDAQRRLFEHQLDLAGELDLPVVVHSRAADDETAAVLEGFDGTVVLHCFSSPPLLEPALAHGWYVSFAGNVTFPKAPELREAAALVPADRILAETDSPYLAPQPRRGRPNEPAFVVHTVETLAEARGEEAAELEARIEANAAAAFRLP